MTLYVKRSLKFPKIYKNLQILFVKPKHLIYYFKGSFFIITVYLNQILYNDSTQFYFSLKNVLKSYMPSSLDRMIQFIEYYNTTPKNCFLQII